MSVIVAKTAFETYCPTCERSFAVGDTVCPDDGARLIRLAPPEDPMIGRELDGRYTIVERLGQGGMGVVYRAKQHSVDREVAIKVVHANLLSDPEVIKRFLREARLASQLSHPNTVAVLDFGQTPDGMFYLVMELITGRTLDEVFLDDGMFDARRLVRIGVQICDALDAAQAMAIVHRDLKPSNIILLDNSRDLVKVLDFGLAKSLESPSTNTTIDGGMCGTPAFIAPERACGRPCDHRSDLYSLGCILYLLGSGSLPFSSDSVHELLRMQVMEPAPLMTGVPLGLAEIIDRLLAKKPADRFQSASELRDALEECMPITGQTVALPRMRAPSPGTEYETAASLPNAPEPPAPPAATPAPPAPAPEVPTPAEVAAEVPRRAPTEHGVIGERPSTAAEMQELVGSATLEAPAITARPARARWWLAGVLAALVSGIGVATRVSDPAAAARISDAPLAVEAAGARVVPGPRDQASALSVDLAVDDALEAASEAAPEGPGPTAASAAAPPATPRAPTARAASASPVGRATLPAPGHAPVRKIPPRTPDEGAAVEPPRAEPATPRAEPAATPRADGARAAQPTKSARAPTWRSGRPQLPF